MESTAPSEPAPPPPPPPTYPSPPPAPSLRPPELEINDRELAVAANIFASHFSGVLQLDTSGLLSTIFSLAGFIDFALSNDDIPTTAKCLPTIIKQVYVLRNDTALLSPITILMISTKIACKNGWFHAAEADELLGLANELCSSFCAGVRATTASNALDVISKIIPKFYPRLKLDCLIVSFEAKPGYDILMGDFHIKNNLPPEKNILLFVVQTDDLETSSCIIRPLQISFLVNGRDVECVNGSQNRRPQLPTDITKILRCGMNIIQALGYFSGNYLLAIASVGTITYSDALILKEYVQPTVSALISDAELIDGPSKITLNCPLSLKRIRCPVKGHLCNHQQCFDYKKFMEMNERIPFWRCICCGQPVSFIDLRVDQNMVKILEEVPEDVTTVFIFPDGSWMLNMEHHRSKEQLDTGIQSGRQDTDIGAQSNRCTTTLPDAMDLTMEDQFQTRKASVQQDSNVTPPNSSNSRPSSSHQGLFSASGVLSQSDFRMHHTRSQTTNIPPQSSRLPVKHASQKTITSAEKSAEAKQASQKAITSAEAKQASQKPITSAEKSAAKQALQKPITSAEAKQAITSAEKSAAKQAFETKHASQKAITSAETKHASQKAITSVEKSVPKQASHKAITSAEAKHASQKAITSAETKHASQKAITSAAVEKSVPKQASHKAITLAEAKHASHKAITLAEAKHASHKAITSAEKSAPNRLAQLSAANLAAARATGLQLHRPSWMASSNPSQRAADGVRLSESGTSQTKTEVVPAAAWVDSFQELPSTENWQPAGRMRGSLSGAAYSAALNQYLGPSSQTVSTRPPASTSVRVSLNDDNGGSRHGTERNEGNDQYRDPSSQPAATRPPASTSVRVSLNDDNGGSRHGTERTEGND